MTVYEVDILEQRPMTWRVEAQSEAEAREKAMAGDGDETSGGSYVFGEVVSIRAREVAQR